MRMTRGWPTKKPPLWRARQYNSTILNYFLVIEMPRRKFGNVVDKGLKKRTKVFLQSLGYTSYVADPIIDQLKPADLKIKYDRSKNVEMEFGTLDIDTRNKNLVSPEYEKFEFIKCTVSVCKFSFIMYISEKNEWRAFVPTKGNYFCKKKRKVYGYCGCHSEKEDQLPHPGSFDEEIQKRMQFAGYLTTSNVKINNFNSRKGESTLSWDEEKLPSSSTSSLLSQDEFSHKRVCHPRCFSKLSGIRDLIWAVLSFVPSEELYSITERVCRLWRDIIRNEVFQKQRWECFRKTNKNKQFNVMENSETIGECVFVPGSYNIGLDGVYESLFYSLSKSSPTPTPSYYHLNKAHIILPTLIDHVTASKERFEKEEKPRGRWSMDYFFPYPLHESFPHPVILRRDLKHDINSDEKLLRSKLEKLDGDNSLLGDMGIDSIEEGMDELRKIHEQSERMPCYKKHTEAQRVISKVFRGKVEYEYFNFKLSEDQNNCKFETVELMRKFTYENYQSFPIDQKQMKVEEYLKELGGESSDQKKSVARVKKVIDDLELVCKNVTVYRTSQLEMEELGYLWIVGEYTDQFLIGYTWFLCAN